MGRGRQFDRVDHGTRTMAQRYGANRCPCDPCLAARRAAFSGHDAETGDLFTACWCDSDAVLVPARDVRDGLTRSCGRIGCEPPEGDL